MFQRSWVWIQAQYTGWTFFHNFLKKNWPIPASFSLFSSFQYSWQKIFNINFWDDWIRTADLWSWKQLLYQLSHNHCPFFTFICCKNCNACLKRRNKLKRGRVVPLKTTYLEKGSITVQRTSCFTCLELTKQVKACSHRAYYAVDLAFWKKWPFYVA